MRNARGASENACGKMQNAILKLRLTRRTGFKTIFCGVPHFFTFVYWSALVVSIFAGGSEPNISAPENNNPMWQKSDCAVELPCGSPADE